MLAGVEAEERRGGRRQPNRWKVIFVALLVAGLVSTLGWVLLGSRLLVVRHVDVSGVSLLTRGQVLDAGKVSLGTPMIRLDTSAVEHRIEALRQVESVDVSRSWPATVKIVIRERRPVVVMAAGNGRFNEIDRYGVTVRTVDQQTPGLPELQVAAESPADPVTRAALGSLLSLPGSLRQKVVAVSADSTESVVFHFHGTGPTTVVWGADERAAQKLRLIVALLRSSAIRGAHSIDVSSPEVVTTR
jgi:cell division protein FtsQ